MTVSDYANQHEMSEYDVFRLAHIHYHGIDGEERILDRDFGSYLNHEVIPHYVRSFLRRPNTHTLEA